MNIPEIIQSRSDDLTGELMVIYHMAFLDSVRYLEKDWRKMDSVSRASEGMGESLGHGSGHHELSVYPFILRIAIFNRWQGNGGKLMTLTQDLQQLRNELIPIAATYVIASDGTVAHAFIEKDYTQRLDIAILRHMRYTTTNCHSRAGGNPSGKRSVADAISGTYLISMRTAIPKKLLHP